MDTHIASHAIVDPDIATLSARLPGERADELPGQNESPPFGPAADTGPAAPEPGERLPRSGASRPKRRHTLLLGVAVVALVAAAGGAFLISPYNHVHPVPRMASTVRHLAASAGIKLPALVAPSASLASITLPPSAPVIHERYTPKPKDQEIQELLALHAGAHPAAAGQNLAGAGHPVRAEPAKVPSAKADGKPAEGAPVRGTSLPADRHDDAGPRSGYVAHEPGAEVPLVRATTAAPPPPHPASGTSTVAQAPAAPAASVPPPQAIAARAQSQRLVAGAAGPLHDVTGAILSSLEPPRTAGAATSASASGQAPMIQVAAASAAAKPAARSVADPVTIAHDLRPAPMTSHDQIQVLNLVTEMATMLRDVRTQDAQLRADFSKSAADTAARLSDFERRLTLAEARNAIADARTAVVAAASGAAGDGANPSVASIPVAGSSPVKTIPVRLTSAAAALPGGAEAVKRYRVQAASPGLALLAEIDRGGGEGAQLQVVVGDSIPGYGRVKSIAQRGTSWVVSTEHGAIQ